MSPVTRSMYTNPETTVLAAAKAPPVPPHAEKDEPPQKSCRWCGKALVNPRRNQVCCSAECREAWERSKRMRRQQTAADKPKGTCLWCDARFDRARKNQDFCCVEHQQAFNNFWKGKGPTLAKAMHAWRVAKTKGAFTDLCREFSAARDELKDKRAKARKDTKRGH